jgi:hypothetical protein
MTTVVPYEPKSFKELEAYAERLAASGMVPVAYKGKPNEVAVAILHGKEIGLTPLLALQSIAVIGNRPCVYGDAMPGLAFNKGLIIDMVERIEGKGEEMMAICEVTRPNGTIVTQTFSVADAKKAGLWDKAGPWKQYPRRMLQWRARSWAIRDAAPHGLFGMSAEEARDIDIAELKAAAEMRDVTPETPESPPNEIVKEILAEPDVSRETKKEDSQQEPISVRWPGDPRQFFLSVEGLREQYHRRKDRWPGKDFDEKFNELNGEDVRAAARTVSD